MSVLLQAELREVAELRQLRLEQLPEIFCLVRIEALIGDVSVVMAAVPVIVLHILIQSIVEEFT
jgi:hypothetical protein